MNQSRDLAQKRLPVTAVVLAYGAGDGFWALVEDLRQQGMSTDRIIVVHNPDESGLRPTPRHGVIPHLLPRNVGYSGGMNVGIHEALKTGAPWLLLLTHDVRLQAGCISELVGAGDTDASFGLLGPICVNPDGRHFSAGGLITRGRWIHAAEHLNNVPGSVVCDWLDGCALLLRRTVAAVVGGFDQRFFMYCEDVDLSLRVQKAGWAVGVVGAAQVTTKPGGASRGHAFAYLMSRNGLATRWRHEGVRSTLIFAALQLRLAAREVVRAVVLRVAPRFVRSGTPAVGLAVISGMLDAVRGRWGAPPGWICGRSDIAAVATVPDPSRDRGSERLHRDTSGAVGGGESASAVAGATKS